MASAVIQTVGLSKVFRDFWQRARVRAVANVDLEVAPGEIFGLLGPNGSGKSTTIKMMLGLLRPTRGRISVFGRPPEDVRTKQRIGYLPEETYLYRFLNARETLDYYGTLFKINRRERTRRIDELLEMVGLRSAARRPVGEYSKGMARRIGLAQALINDPDLLILDEPTSGLDPVGSKLVKDIIVRLGTVYKKTILLSSHLLADVEEVCRRVAILYGGKVQVAGKMEDVLARRGMMQISCESLSPDTLREVQDLVMKREGKRIDVSTPHDRLETLFLRIVEDAHRERVETAGAAAAGDIATFLGEDQQRERVLSELLAPAAPSGAPSTTQPVARAPQVDRGVLDSLVRSKATADAEERDDTAAGQTTPAEEVDRGMLDALTGKGGRELK